MRFTVVCCHPLGGARFHPFLFGGALALCACSSNSPPPAKAVLASAPPIDDGRASEGSVGGTQHAAALEQLKTAPLAIQVDKQNSVRLPLPDGGNWMKVKFTGVKSLVGFRYGKDHHGIVGGFVTHVKDNSEPGACVKAFEDMAMPWIKAFEVELQRDPPTAVMWKRPAWPGENANAIAPVPIEIESTFAKTATLLMKQSYAGAWATYPAWQGACLVMGVAIPTHEDEQRARDVRDRFVREVLPKVEVLSGEEPKERF
jgi:hypothetical protein